jgi:DNA-directed RNA polymerase subunit L
VEIAAYSLEHPLVNKVKMIVGVNKGDVRGTILKAVETIKKETKELKTEFSKKV